MTKNLPSGLPLALLLAPNRVQTCHTNPVDNILGSIMRLQATNISLKCRRGEVVALTHNYKRLTKPFFLAVILAENYHTEVVE
jgi:hypothetical protein